MSTACVSTKRASARLRENPAQRYASNYFFVFNGYLAPGEQPVDESTTPGREVHDHQDANARDLGMKDTAILSGHLSGLEKWVPNLSVKLYPDDDHWVMLEKNTSVAQDIRQFIADKDFPKESVYRR